MRSFFIKRNSRSELIPLRKESNQQKKQLVAGYIIDFTESELIKKQ